MKKRSTSKYISKVSSFGFVFPAILVVALLLLYPVFSSVFYSFTSKNLIKPTYDFVGFKNYIKVLNDSKFHAAFLTSCKWTLLSLIGQILVGFTAALALDHIKKGKGIYRTILIIHGLSLPSL